MCSYKDLVEIKLSYIINRKTKVQKDILKVLEMNICIVKTKQNLDTDKF